MFPSKVFDFHHHHIMTKNGQRNRHLNLQITIRSLAIVNTENSDGKSLMGVMSYFQKLMQKLKYKTMGKNNKAMGASMDLKTPCTTKQKIIL